MSDLKGLKFNFNVNDPSEQVLHAEAHGSDQLFVITGQLIPVIVEETVCYKGLKLRIRTSKDYAPTKGFDSSYTPKITKQGRSFVISIKVTIGQQNFNEEALYADNLGNPAVFNLASGDVLDLQGLEAASGPKRICIARAVFGG